MQQNQNKKKQDKKESIEISVKNLKSEVLDLETKFKGVIVSNLDLLEGETAEHTKHFGFCGKNFRHQVCNFKNLIQKKKFWTLQVLNKEKKKSF